MQIDFTMPEDAADSTLEKNKASPPEKSQVQILQSALAPNNDSPTKQKDNNKDKESNREPMNSSTWTRDLDRAILVGAKETGANVNTWSRLSASLHRTAEELSNRYSQLMELVRVYQSQLN